MRNFGLYIHIPFCEKKCRYCGFLSFAGYDPSDYELYTRAVCLEIKNVNEQFAADNEADTVYIGGGTPSLLSGEQIARIIRAARETFHISRDAEITIESNPNSLNEEKLAAYLEAGIGRLSMGAQSMDDNVLDSLGRVHRAHNVIFAFENARKAGFKNINIDLMFGVPEQSSESVFSSVSRIIELNPEHVSLYGLQLEEDTIFYEEYKSGMLDLPSEDEERRIYHKSVSLLKDAGYEHYEISNLARPGYRCIHNLGYWDMKNYLGFGLGAHSYLNGSRSKNTDYMDEYLMATESGTSPSDESAWHYDTPKDAMGIFVFTALRKSEGVNLDEFSKRFGRDFFSVYKDKSDVIKGFIDDGLLCLSGRSMRLTERGIDFSNDIMCEFV